MRPATAPSKVLEFLAKRPGLTTYTIAKESNLSYSRVYESVQLLVKAGLIKGTTVGKTRARLDKKTYALTMLGFTLLADFYNMRRRSAPRRGFLYSWPKELFFGPVSKMYFGTITESEKKDLEKKGLYSPALFEEKLDYLMKNYEAFFPLIAGKWDFFKKNKINQLIITRLGLTHTSKGISDNSNTGYTKEFFQDFFQDISADPITLLRVVKIFTEDPDLRHVAYENLKNLHEWYRFLSVQTAKILRNLERQKSCPPTKLGKKEMEKHEK